MAQSLQGGDNAGGVFDDVALVAAADVEHLLLRGAYGAQPLLIDIFQIDVTVHRRLGQHSDTLPLAGRLGQHVDALHGGQGGVAVEEDVLVVGPAHGWMPVWSACRSWANDSGVY